MWSTMMTRAEEALEDVACCLPEPAADEPARDGRREPGLRRDARMANRAAHAERDRQVPVRVDEHGPRLRLLSHDVVGQRRRRREAHRRFDVAVEAEATLAPRVPARRGEDE